MTEGVKKYVYHAVGWKKHRAREKNALRDVGFHEVGRAS
jgi:hypothetical protein